MGEPTDARYQEIKLSIAALYNAGRRLIPDKADDTSEGARQVSIRTDALDGAAASANNPKPLLDALATCDDVYDALTQMVKTRNYAAQGLVHTADGFVKREDEPRRRRDTCRRDWRTGTSPGSPTYLPTTAIR